MKFKNVIVFFTLFLSIDSAFASKTLLGDTIRLAPVEKKKLIYLIQPLVIKTSITGFLAGGVIPFTSEYRFTAEITSGRKQSEQVSLSYLGKNVIWAAFEKGSKLPLNDILKVNGWRIQYAHKFYLVNRRHYAPFGFYFAPHFSYTNAKIAPGLNHYYRNAYYDVRHLTADLLFGVQMGKIKRMTLDICAGLGYKSNTIYYHVSSNKSFKYDSSDFGSYYNNHFHVLFDLSMGYSF